MVQLRTSGVWRGLLLAAAWLCAPSIAQAQCRLCAVPSPDAEAAKTPPVQLQVETSLDFDRLVLGSSGTGSAVLAPDGSHRTSGSVLTLGARAMVGTVTVHGEPGRAIQVSLPHSISLYGWTGGEMRLDSILSDLPSLPRIGANGSLTFRFGGELHVSGDADGRYRGEFQVDVDYL